MGKDTLTGVLSEPETREAAASGKFLRICTGEEKASCLRHNFSEIKSYLRHWLPANSWPSSFHTF